jgi:hypothetical protein
MNIIALNILIKAIYIDKTRKKNSSKMTGAMRNINLYRLEKVEKFRHLSRNIISMLQ